MTVRELIMYLENYDKDKEVMICKDTHSRYVFEVDDIQNRTSNNGIRDENIVCLFCGKYDEGALK